MNWRDLGTREKVDLVQHVKEYLSENPEAEVMIGTDSQNIKSKTLYALVVALHTKRGSHIIYTKESFERIRDRFSRLLKEVDFTIQIAEELRKGGVAVSSVTLDFDLNPDPKYKSNEVITTALGWGRGLGYHCRVKPESLAASYAADKILR